jgi:hypothetical protein
MYTWMNKWAYPCKACKIGLAVAVLVALTGGAMAQPRYLFRADQFYSIYPGPNQEAAPSRWDRARFDRSGTRGRYGLGASPARPEGQGNVSD